MRINEAVAGLRYVAAIGLVGEKGIAMAKAQQKTQDSPELPDALNETQAEILQHLERTSAAVLDGVTKWNNEVTRFISERIREDVRTQKECLCCRDFNELREIQFRFFKQAAGEYANETDRLMKLSGEILSQSIDTD